MHRSDDEPEVFPDLLPGAVAPTAPGAAPVATVSSNAALDVAQVAAPAPPPMPKRVLVVDDELAGLASEHLRESAAAFVAELEDVNSPSVEATWAVVVRLLARKPFDDVESAEVAAYFATDEFVRDVVLSAEFQAAHVPASQHLTGFYERNNAVQVLKGMLVSAYPPPQFEVTFAATRPMPASELLAYDLVILDLVLLRSAGAVDELVRYLKDLSADAGSLPRLIVLSSRQEMVENRPRFSTESNISAAGLLLLEKAHVRHAQFGAAGLALAYQQLDRQRDAAQKMRVFVSAWMAALERAKAAAAETLWNLDAAAMQEIHLSAIGDDDPYDEHLNELVAREYLYHVETSTDVAHAIEALDVLFQRSLKTTGNKVSIGQRFMAPFANSKPGRTIVSHFNWTGFTPTSALDEISTEDLALRFNRLVPFGAVLAPPDLVSEGECWVHITQQCDLNSAVRGKKRGDEPAAVSAMFAVVSMMPVSDQSVPVHQTEELVARGLRVGNQEFDLKLTAGRLISLPIGKLIETARASRMQVVGRLRHDIANQFLNATANHMTRPAQLKATRVEVRPGRVYLWGPGMPDNAPVPFIEHEGGTVRTVLVSQNNKLHYFQDEASMRLALWIASQLAAHFDKPGLDVGTICNTLSVGMTRGGNVISALHLAVEERAFDGLSTFWAERKPPKGPQLYVFHEPS